MPLFRRADGDPVPNVAPIRRIQLALMRRRNESAVYHESLFGIDGARAWLKAYNRAHEARATLFHLVAYACAGALHARPGLNRFSSGGRLYQRRGVQIAFVAKRAMSDEAPFASVKLDVGAREPFPEFVARITGAIDGARGAPRAIEREMELFLHIPTRILRSLVGLVTTLDDWNLLPGWFTRDDPMFSSAFLANLGSAGIGDAWHHLYEYGNCPVFGAVSAPKRLPVAEGDAVVVRHALRIRWTFDERINDGFYAARSLALVEQILSDPSRHLGLPEGTPSFAREQVSAP